MGAKPRSDSLAHYEDPFLYESAFQHRHHDIEYFADLAERLGGPVLEYGCGSGRATLPIAARGVDVTGVDASAAMLRLLEQRTATPSASLTFARHASRSARRTGQIRLVQGDMRKKRLRSRFPLILATFNVVAHMRDRTDMAAFLQRVREHLAPGGLFVFDFAIPHPEEVEADPDETYPTPRFKHPETGEWIRQTERFRYDVPSQELSVENEYAVEGSRDSITVPLILRQWFPREMEALLTYEGFDVQLFADYTEHPIATAEDMIVVHARPRARRPSTK